LPVTWHILDMDEPRFAWLGKEKPNFIRHYPR